MSATTTATTQQTRNEMAALLQDALHYTLAALGGAARGMESGLEIANSMLGVTHRARRGFLNIAQVNAARAGLALAIRTRSRTDLKDSATAALDAILAYAAANGIDAYLGRVLPMEDGFAQAPAAAPAQDVPAPTTATVIQGSNWTDCSVPDCTKGAHAWTCPALADGYVEACRDHAQQLVDAEIAAQAAYKAALGAKSEGAVTQLLGELDVIRATMNCGCGAYRPATAPGSWHLTTCPVTRAQDAEEVVAAIDQDPVVEEALAAHGFTFQAAGVEAARPRYVRQDGPRGHGVRSVITATGDGLPRALHGQGVKLVRYDQRTGSVDAIHLPHLAHLLMVLDLGRSR